MERHRLAAERRHFGWNRDHAPALVISPGDVVEFGVMETSGGEITRATTVADLDALDRSKFAPLTGPVAIDGAEPGDALKITFLAFNPSGWGWSVISPRYGILAADFPEPFLKIWDYDPSAPARHAGAQIPLKPFPGIIGVAPAGAGLFPSLPPYPTGGNLDIRDLSLGTSLFLPVEAPKALLSLGDSHMAQGHGELAGTALESSMDITVKIELIKSAALSGPRLATSGPTTRHLDSHGYHVSCGVSADLREAACSAARQMIDLLAKEYAIAAIDAYLLCSLAGDLVINEMVNTPRSVVSLYFPRALFEG